MPHSRLRWPSRSPITPNIGDTRVPAYCSAPNSVSSSTDPVSVSTYQPRISVSISKAQEVSRSAGHWRRKLRFRKSASAESPTCRLKLCAQRQGCRAAWRFPLLRRDRNCLACRLACVTAAVLGRRERDCAKNEAIGPARQPFAAHCSHVSGHGAKAIASRMERLVQGGNPRRDTSLARLNPARGSPCRRRAWARTRWTWAA